MTWAVFNEEEVGFESVEWGRTKVLVGRTAPEGRGLTQKVLLKITEYLPSLVHSMHVHPDQDEVIFILSGTGISRTDGKQCTIRPGDVVHVPAGIMHETYNPGKEPLRAVIVKVPPDYI